MRNLKKYFFDDLAEIELFVGQYFFKSRVFNPASRIKFIYKQTFFISGFAIFFIYHPPVFASGNNGGGGGYGNNGINTSIGFRNTNPASASGTNGLVLDDSQTLNQSLAGGNGGTGANASAPAGANGGGGGGTAVVTSAVLTNNGAFQGGGGGAGGSSSSGNGGAGGGGAGVLTSAGLINSGTITGGNGGSSSLTAGGGGGAGVVVSGNALPVTITNTGTIQGGQGGTSRFVGFAPGIGGTGEGGAEGARSAGAYSRGGAAITGSNIVVNNHGALTAGNGGNLQPAFSADFKSGDLNKLNIFNGSNIFGDIRLGSGKLEIVALESSKTLNNNILAQGEVNFNSDDFDITSSGVVSGTGSVKKSGESVLVLSGVNTYSGGTFIEDGTVRISNNASLGSITGGLALNGGTLETTSSFTVNRQVSLGSSNGTIQTNLGTNLTVGSIIRDALAGTAGGLGKTGAGTLTLTSTNTYTGGTTINAGSLALSGNGSLAATGTLNLANTGTAFDISQATANQTVGALSGVNGSAVNLGARTLTFGDATDQTMSGVVSGTGALVKQGAGTQTLTSANTYTGGTSITNGTLQLGAGGTTGSIVGDVANAGTLAFNRSDDVAFNGVVSGTGNVNQVGTGVTTLTGTNTYTGGTSITNGTLQLGAGGTTGSIVGDVANAGTLAFNRSDDVAFNGVVSGTGNVNQVGTGVTTLTGTNTYTGGTSITNGTLQLGAGGTTGSILGDVANAGTLAFNRSDDVAFNGVVSGTGNVNQVGTGVTTLTGTNTYTGGTSITNGTLQLGAGGTTGSILGDVANAGTLAFNRSDDVAFNGVVSGTGNVNQVGTGVTTLTGTNTYTGGTSITNGTLQLGAGGTTGSILGDVANAGTLAFNRSDDVAFNGVVSGTGNVNQVGNGVTTLTGTNTYTGGTSITNGTLQLGAGGTTGSILGDVANAGTLAFNRSDDVAFNGVVSGTGNVNQVGTGVTTLTGTNTYTGGTSITNGTLQLGAGGTTGSILGDVANAGTLAFNRSDDVAFNGVVSGTGNVNQVGTGVTTLTGTNTYTGGTSITNGTLQLGAGGTTGSILGDVANAGTLAFNRSDDVAFNGVVSGTGNVNQVGTGVTTLTGTNTYTGGTSITNGTLQLGAGGTTGSILGDVANAGTLAFNRSDDVAFNGVVSGTGNVNQVGNGVTTLTGTNTYTGGTSITNGTLQLGAGGTTGSILGDVANAGTLAFNRSDDVAFNGVVSGTGNVNQVGTGVTTLTGTNTYTGGTSITNGTLQLGAGGTTGSILGDVANAGTLAFNRSDDVAFNGVVSGTGNVNQVGNGVTTLTGTNTYTGGTSITNGTLQLGAGGTTGSILGDVANAGTLAFNRSDDVAFNGVVSGTGNVNQVGTGVTTLTGTNTYTGGTSITNGTLQLGAGGTTGSIVGDVANAGTLAFNRSDDVAFNGVVSGTGNVNQVGNGVTTLTGTNTYTGGTSITNGTLQLGAGGTTGSILGDVANAGTLAFNRSDDVAFNGVVSGTGNVNQVGTGVTTLTGTNTYTGGTSITNGTLQLGAGGTTGSIVGDVANAGTLAFNRSDDVAFNGVVSGTGNVNQVGNGVTTLTGTNTYTGGTSITNGTLQLGAGGTTGSILGDVANAGTLAFNRSDDVAFNGVVSGTGNVNQVGTGVTTLTGTNTYTGGTSITNGTLQLGAGGTTGSILGDVANAGTLAFNRSDDVAFNGVVSGTGNVNQVGTGVTTLTGTNTYTGGTSITNGTLQLGAGGTTGSIVGDVANAGTLAFNRSDDVAFNGVVSGTGNVNQVATGVTTLTGTNTYTGGTSITNGTLQLGAGGTTGSIVGDVANAGTLAFNRSDDVAFNGVVSGTGNVNQVGNGVTTLTGTNTYTGGTSITNGTLQLGAGGTTGSILGDVANAGTLAFNRSDDVAFNGVVSGTGNVNQVGTGVTTLTGTNTYTGGTSITNGTLQLGAGGTTGSILGDVANAGTLAFNRSDDVAFNGVVSGTGNVNQVGTGVTTLTGTNTYTGGTSITNGTLQLGAGGTTGSILGDVANAGTLAFNRSDDVAFNGVVSGTGNVNQVGNGVTTLTGTNTYTGGTSITNGTLQLGAGGTTGSILGDVANAGTLAFNRSDDVAFNGVVSGTGNVNQVGTGVTTLTGTNTYTGGTSITNGTLQLGAGGTTGSILGDVANAGTLAFNRSDDVAFNGVVSGTGNVNQVGTGVTTLTGTNTYTGGTSITNGTLQLGAGGTTGSILGDVANAGTLAFNRSDDVAFNGVVSGTGNVNQVGTGVTTLTGTNTYTGGTSITNGTLQLGAGGTTGSILGDVANAGTLAFNRSDDVAFNGVVSGTGNVNQVGNGVTTLTGTNTYTGGTSITNGTLQLGAGGTTGSILGDVANAGTLAFNRSDDVAFNGVVSGTGNVNQVGTGVTTLTGTNTYTGGTSITNGTLQLGAGGTTGSILGDVANAGTLAFNRSDDVAFNGVVSGTGNVNQVGTGVTTLTGTNTYTGGTSITNGTLQLGAGGTTGSILGDVANAGTLAFNRSDDVAFNGVVSGTGNVNQVGNGVTTLTGTNTYTGGTSITNGTLQLGAGGTTGSILGDVANAGTLAFNRSDDVAFNGVVSGTGNVNQVGTGVTTLTGTNTYTGGTSITNGTLQLGAGGTTGSILGDVANAGTLAFNRSDDVAFNGVVSGTGNVNQVGNGVTTLTGTNTYTGGTSITNGTLQLGAGGTTGSILGDVANAGTLAFNRSDDVAFNGVVSGTGNVNQVGTGVTTLTGTNTYTGGTSINAGTLALSGNGSLAATGALNLANTGTAFDISQATANQTVGALSGVTGSAVKLGARTLTFGDATDQTMSGLVSGTGALVKQGTGTQSLTSANTYTGGTFLKYGRINLGNNDALGTDALSMDGATTLGFIVNNLNLANNITLAGRNDSLIDTGVFDATLSGAISGGGFITKEGTGALTLSGTNTYSGATNVTEGTLRSGATNTFSAASAHSVAAGASMDLAGFNQSIASLTNTGTVSLAGTIPGTTLTVNGQYIGNDGVLKLGTLLNATGPSDRLVLNGPDAVASGHTQVAITNLGGLGALTQGNGIEVISARNGATTTAQTTKDAFSLGGGHVDAGAYEYRLFAGDTAGAGENWYLRSRSTDGVISYRSEVPLYAALSNQLRDGNVAMLGDLRKRQGDDDLRVPNTTLGSLDRRAWARVITSGIEINQGGTASASSKGRVSGLQVGSDLLAVDNWRAGAYIGQLEGDVSVDGFFGGLNNQRAGTNSLRSRYVGLYGTYNADDGFYVDTVMQSGRHHYTVDPAVSHGVKGTGNSLLASVEVGQTFPLGSSAMSIEPQLQLIRQHLDLNDSTIPDAQVKSEADDNWIARAGVRVKGEINTSIGLVQPYGRVNLYKTSNETDNSRFVNGNTTTDISAPTGGRSTELAAGVTLPLMESAVLYFEFGKLWSSGGNVEERSPMNGSIGVRLSW